MFGSQNGRQLWDPGSALWMSTLLLAGVPALTYAGSSEAAAEFGRWRKTLALNHRGRVDGCAGRDVLINLGDWSAHLGRHRS